MGEPFGYIENQKRGNLPQFDGTGWTRIASGTSGQTLIVQSTGLWAAQNLGQWANFTPGVSQNGARTVTVNVGRYCTIGNVAFVIAVVTITNAGTAANAITMTGLPANITNGASRPVVGSFHYLRSGVIFYAGICQRSGSDSVIDFSDSAQTNTLGITPSFATANTDVLSVNLMYEYT